MVLVAMSSTRRPELATYSRSSMSITRLVTMSGRAAISSSSRAAVSVSMRPESCRVTVLPSVVFVMSSMRIPVLVPIVGLDEEGLRRV